ncbi:hypothetical protein [Streptomyces sp. WAC 01529]|uniref:hypothetical protein n=1 Tax=Streptomyces sp. WAC 01529 TaxID=2203205 RepID=UPI0019D1D73C|nr:hypothetical protein [Streptomyces sp. WAC 01529]
MTKLYKRTENGVTAFVSKRQGLDEINHAQMDGKRAVHTMSSITRTDYDIEYKDGRSVRLVLVDAPAPEGFTQGQPVVVQHPGRPSFTGTVAHIHTAPGYVAVRDDRRGDVITHPTRFVSPAETEEESEAGPKAWTGEPTRIITVKGKRYAVSPIHPAPPWTVGATSGVTPAHVDYWSERNGKTFGATRSANGDAKPGTVGRAIWDAVNAG